MALVRTQVDNQFLYKEGQKLQKETLGVFCGITGKATMAGQDWKDKRREFLEGVFMT